MPNPNTKAQTRSRRLHRICGAGLVAFMATCAGAQQVPRFPMPEEQVRAAMRDHQLPTEGVDIQLPGTLTSSVAAPMLEIQTVSRLDAHRAQMRMACRVHAECLPFYVSVALSDAATWPVPSPPAHGASSAPASTASPTLRAGAHATLMIEGDRLHIRIPVVCLQSGTSGDKVRVASLDRRQNFIAEIISENLLKGSL